jgi:hypothetical protein
MEDKLWGRFHWRKAFSMNAIDELSMSRHVHASFFNLSIDL